MRMGARGLQLLLLLLIILAAFALRIHALEYQSLWSDEGLSLYRARQPLSAVFANTITVDGIDTKDTNPAFYFLLLHGWRSLAGESVFALRFLGAALAALSVPLIYGLTTAVLGRWSGLATAVFLAVSPLHVWQSQILRNYGLLVTLNLLSVYGLVRFMQSAGSGRRWAWLGVWAAAGFLSIFSHYFGFFVMAYGGLVLTLYLLWQWLHPASGKKKLPGRWFWLILGLLLMLLIPLTLTAYDRFQIGQQIDFYQTPPLDFFTHALHVFSAGDIPGIIHPWQRVWPAALLAALGLIFGWRRSRAGTLFILGYQLIPLGLLILLSAITPLYNGTRHLLIALPPFLIFCGAGMAGGWTAPIPVHKSRRLLFRLLQWSGLVLGLLVLLIQGSRLLAQFTDPVYLRDDVRGAANYLNRLAKPEDVIILHDTLIGFTFAYYYDGAAPWLAAPRFGQMNEEEVTAVFAQAGEVPGRIWFLSSPTPRTGFSRGHLLDWADENWSHLVTKPFPSFWLGTELRAYLPDPAVTTLPADANPVTAVYPSLQLHGLRHDAVIQAGQPWWLSLYWSAPTADSADYGLSLRLLDHEGRLWQQTDIPLWRDPAILAQNAPPLRADYEITFPAGLPPGEYSLALRLLGSSQQPLPDAEGRLDTPLSQVSVSSSRDPRQLPPLTPQTANLGPLTLHGFVLPETVKPGHLVPLDLYWQVRRPPSTDLQLKVELLDSSQNVIDEGIEPLSRSDYPPSSWQAGEVLHTPASLLVPGTAGAGPHTIRLTLIEPDAQAAGKPVTLSAELVVTEWPLETTLPPLPQPMAAAIGDPPVLYLRGIDLPETNLAPGAVLPLTLIWQAAAAPDANYVVFVHLVGEDGTIVAQRDGMPAQGFRPTASWRADEVIIDPQDLVLDPGIQAGVYQLYAGLYDPASGERPFTQLNGSVLPDGRIPLGSITLEVEP